MRGCVDKHSFEKCDWWKRHNACHTHPERMRRLCAKTCNMCETILMCKGMKCEKPRLCVLDAYGLPQCVCTHKCKHRKQKRRLGMVCGTDGKEHVTICKMEHTACLLNTTISVRQFGSCPAASPPCFDGYGEEQCRAWRPFGVCKKYPKLMRTACQFTCGWCNRSNGGTYASELKKQFDQPACQRSPYGCCWDQETSARGPGGYGCPACQDNYKFCQGFVRDCNSSQSKNRDFMMRHCKHTCTYCT